MISAHRKPGCPASSPSLARKEGITPSHREGKTVTCPWGKSAQPWALHECSVDTSYYRHLS